MLGDFSMTERVAIFIDGSNLYHCLKGDFRRVNLDFEKFANRLCGDRYLIRTYYYNAPIRAQDDAEAARRQQDFFNRLRDLSYFRVKLGRLEPRGNTFVEKGVDVALAVDMLQLAYRNVYGTAILVSGDADFATAMEAVQDLGKHVENAIGRTGQSDQLRQTCDRFILLTEDLLQDCWLT
jgi:uncharacterized LabA/DUF88 family protein